jgi:hypothetical protein
MKNITKLMTFIGLLSTSQLAYSGSITDTYNTGDTLTATTLNNIKSAVNDNDRKKYAIGDVGPAGGWVFNVTLGGLHGLEAAPNDIPSLVTWGCANSLNLKTITDTEYRTGARNTDAILYDCIDRGNAADLAVKYDQSVGFYDWYLPSRDELRSMLQQIGHASPINDGNRFAKFKDAIYWSSSVSDALPLVVTPWVIDFTLPGFNEFDQYGTTNRFSVRPIRSF